MKPLGSRILIGCALASALVVVREHLAAPQGLGLDLIGLAKSAANVHPANSHGSSGHDQAQLARITIDYPEEGSIFRPEITAPTFIWHDAAPTATAWQVEVVFSDGSAAIQLKSPGERMQIGEIDTRCICEHEQAAGADTPTGLCLHLEAR